MSLTFCCWFNVADANDDDEDVANDNVVDNDDEDDDDDDEALADASHFSWDFSISFYF